MGQILHSGGFNPQADPNNAQKPPHQNFTVTVPSNLPKGSAQIGIAHFSLIGVSSTLSPTWMLMTLISQAGLEPFMEVKNVSVIVQ
jgi:hypothetical protein